MPPDIRERIFDPFFTTKKRGQGTGLGLATVYGVVQQADGFIYVYSEPDQGTTFRIYVLATEGESTTQTPKGSGEEKFTGHEAIMMVEDDDAMRELRTRILRQAGFEVSDHALPEEALASLTEDSTFDLLLTDIVMPGLSGPVLAGQVKAKLGDLPVIYMSGYSEDLLDERGHLEEGVSLLQKPFSARDLLRTVRAVLDE
jgi:CheY-like chemotaxis protein